MVPKSESLPRGVAPQPRAALRHRAFRSYVGSWLLGNLGAQMLGVADAWQVYAIGHRAIDLGYVGLAQFVPAFALSLPGGAVADRFDRAKIVAICNLVQALAAAALLAIAVRAAGRVGPVIVVLVLAGAAQAFEGPAGQALVSGLVPAEDLPNAVAWTSTVWQGSTIVGPALGGLLYGAAQRATWVYGACAGVLLVASGFALMIRAPPVAPAGASLSWAEVLAGVRFVRARPVLRESILLDLFAVLLGGATALLPLYASDILHVGAQGLGVLRSAPAVGAAVMALALAHRPLARRAGPILLASVATFGAATIAFGLSQRFALSLAALVVLGASDMVSVVVRSTVVALRTPHAMRGRVSAVSMMCIVASSHLGELESGVTASWFGAVPAIVLGGVGTLVVVAVYAFVFKTLRAVDRLDEAE